MNDEQRTKLETNVAEWLKDHVYTELTNANGVELWRCQKPGSHNLAFDICVTRYGTAVFGDIGHLTFDIDASYGIHYLANTGLHNLHGKLAASCKEEWIDLDAILDTVRDCIYEVLDDEEVVYPEGLTVQSLIGWLEAKDEEELGPDLPFSQWVELLASVGCFDDGSGRDIVPAFDLLAESEELLRTSDLWESTISKPSDHVWRKLVYVQHAAGAIMAQKEKTAAPVYAYALTVQDEYWCDDSLAEFLSDRVIVEGAVIARAEAVYPDASRFLPDVGDVLEHMSNDASASDYSEFVDDFPSVTTEAKAELEPLLEPLKRWANKHCSVRFFRVESAEPYTVTSADVAAAKRYLDLRRQLATKDLEAVDVTAHSSSTAVES